MKKIQFQYLLFDKESSGTSAYYLFLSLSLKVEAWPYQRPGNFRQEEKALREQIYSFASGTGTMQWREPLFQNRFR
jgi:hypothetical protein